MEAEKPDAEDGPYQFAYKLLDKNETFLDRLTLLKGDDLEEMRDSARSFKSQELGRQNLTFNVGMGLTLIGFAGLAGSCVFPGIPQVAGSLALLGLGTGMTHVGLHSKSHEPFDEVAAQLDNWKSYLRRNPRTLPQGPLERARATYLAPEEIETSRVRNLAEELQRSLDEGRGMTPMGRRAYGNEAEARRLNPRLLDNLKGQNLADMDQSRRIAFHDFMGSGVLDGKADLLQGVALFGAVVAWLHPEVSLLPGLIGVGLLGATGFAVEPWERFHQEQKRDAEQVATAVSGWRTAIAQTDARQGVEAARVVELAERPLDESLEIEFEENAIEVGSQLLEVEL